MWLLSYYLIPGFKEHCRRGDRKKNERECGTVSSYLDMAIVNMNSMQHIGLTTQDFCGTILLYIVKS